MFTKSKDEITFSDVEDFCREFGEGVRVEYKQEVKHISKIVSSFANTQGGIFIIGVEADKTTNKVTSIPGIPKRGGLEEQIIQSAITGIYPAVLPEVIILDVPTNPNHVVVVVRVEESMQAPHAIQNSTRVYIRTGSVTQPYELAEIDRIEYLLKRREDSQIVVQQILERIEERVSAFCDLEQPDLTVIARPVFPYRPIIQLRDIYDFAHSQPRIVGTIGGESRLRQVSGGVLQLWGERDSYSYWELNQYGIVYRRLSLLKRKSQREITHSACGPSDVISQTQNNNTEQNEKLYLNFAEIVGSIGALLRCAQPFFERCEYLGNIEISAQLQNVLNEELMYVDNPFFDTGKNCCYDLTVPAYTLTIVQELSKESRFIAIVDELAEQILWSFNCNPSDRTEYVERILRGHQLL